MKMNVKKLLALVLAIAMMLALCSPAFALSKGDVLECTGDDVNVRKGAGTSYGKLGQLDKGDKVTYLGKSGKWYKVEYNGKTAYVTSQYLKLSAAAGSSTDAANGTTLYATTGVRVRKGASTKTAQVGALAKDQAVEKLGKSGDWIQISYKGSKAYVHGKYLTATVPESVKAEQELAASLNAVLLTQSTYVFRGPGKDYGFIIDYIGIRDNMREAMKIYGGDNSVAPTADDVEQATIAFKEELMILKDMFAGYDLTPFLDPNGDPALRYRLLAKAAEYVFVSTQELQT